MRGDLVEGDLVVAVDGRVRAQLAQEVDEVVGEAVVVIDDEEAHGPLELRIYTVSSRESGIRLGPATLGEISALAGMTPWQETRSAHCPTRASPA